MKRTQGRVVHVESLDDLDRRLGAGARTLGSWRVRGLDLRERAEALRARDVAGATFVDCRLAPDDASALERGGALLVAGAYGVPLDADRTELYSADELYDRPTYADTLDARVYAWSQQVEGRDDTRVAALHDHAIDRALAEWVDGRRIVGVMGGHALQRDDPGYTDAARLGHALAGRDVVATGGGPGAMEAANLGARCPDETSLDAALQVLRRVPSFRPSIDDWVGTAREALDGAVSPGGGRESLGVPTWFYGHEPPNLFASAIAKYVRNAQREAALLEVCHGGIVFLPGTAGTVQEVFQDACENYYADECSLAPMVLVGRRYWTEDLPLWPLLRALAGKRAMAEHVHLVDSVDEAAAVVAG